MADSAETPVDEAPAPEVEPEAAAPEAPSESTPTETVTDEGEAESSPPPPPAAPTGPIDHEAKWQADEEARMAAIGGASDPWNDPEPSVVKYKPHILRLTMDIHNSIYTLYENHSENLFAVSFLFYFFGNKTSFFHKLTICILSPSFKLSSICIYSLQSQKLKKNRSLLQLQQYLVWMWKK